MIIVIIAGGSGTRLWPLSQANRPKHLLKLTGQRSLLQNTFKRASLVTDKIYVVTEQSHSDEVAQQLPQLKPDHIIIEPGRRGTASCIILALASMHKTEPDDEPVIFLHADHHISDEQAFAETVKTAGDAAARHSRITLIGIKPTYPATGFGYIELAKLVEQKNGMDISDVVRFVEKPSLPVAEEFLKAGNYVWNLGLFAAPRAVFLERMKRHAPDLLENYDTLSRAVGNKARLSGSYLALSTRQIEYALMEMVPDLLAVSGTFDWADIGSFFDLHNVMSDTKNNTIKGDVQLIDSDDVLVMSQGKPVVVIGLSGVIVVDTPEGLLVCAKEEAQLVGEAAKKLAARDK